MLYLKGMNPGPTIFLENPQNIYAVFLVFLLSNLLLFPLGWALIKVARNVLHVPRQVLMPIILLFCVVGAYSINNSVFDVGVMLAFGLLAYLQHRRLCAILHDRGRFPADAVDFLNLAAERNLLRKVGGGYTFVHALLLDYFNERP